MLSLSFKKLVNVGRGARGSRLGEGVSARRGVLRSESLAPGAAASPSPCREKLKKKKKKKSWSM